MKYRYLFIQGAALLLLAGIAQAEDRKRNEVGGVYSLWPLFDYRTSPATGYSNLSLLGPLFKREQNGNRTTTAFRPLFFSTASADSIDTSFLYPLASTSWSEGSADAQVLQLFQYHLSHGGTPEEKQESMLFPLYISGVSETKGAYTSVFPFHGTIYNRFWRDEYHYTLFPLYSRTVKQGTTTTNWLYPLFSTIKGEQEQGFQFWPLYGHAAKEGVYDKTFALWPIYFHERLNLNTDNPEDSTLLFPLYASSRSPQRSSTHVLWPFFGVVRDGTGNVTERDMLWPFWVTATGKDFSVKRFIPFYAETRIKDRSSHWYLWPLVRTSTIDSPQFRQDRFSLCYFLYNNTEERWPQLDKHRSVTTLWPLFASQRTEEGIHSLTIPALVEPVIWTDGIENSWAPLWRVINVRWDDRGNHALSVLWNLYWHEKREEEFAWGLSPLVSYQSAPDSFEIKLLQGLFGYRQGIGASSVSLLWITFGGNAK